MIGKSYVNLFLYNLVIFIILILRSNRSTDSIINPFYKKCLLKKMKSDLKYSLESKYGKDLWQLFLKGNNQKKKLCNFLRNMNLFSYNNSFFFHRLYTNSQNEYKISVDGVFPDETYLRLTPANKKNTRNVISHTYEVQNYIYNYQHPSNCQKKRYLIIEGYKLTSGHGSEIHVISTYLALAMTLNRIAIFNPYYQSIKASGEYCTNEKNWLCFLEQLTNCSLPFSSYNKSNKFINNKQKNKYLSIEDVAEYRTLIPPIILQIMNNTSISKNKLLHFWRIQSATYIFRLNNRTNVEVNKILQKSLNNNLRKGCFNIWVRHGDKYKEMKLLHPKDYIPSFEIYSKIFTQKLPIYLSTDDPAVTQYFDKYNMTKSYYLNFTRKNGNYVENMKRGAEMTINFIADIKASLYCHGFSGTRQSNVVRLIDELRSTVGLSANALYFENGLIEFSNTSYEIDEFW